jgi:hypothetical protein
MIDKIEQVAKAINDTMLQHGDYKPDELARAAIAAMREPNEAMFRKLRLYENHPDKEFVMDGGMWREMIDAALEEQ